MGNPSATPTNNFILVKVASDKEETEGVCSWGIPPRIRSRGEFPWDRWGRRGRTTFVLLHNFYTTIHLKTREDIIPSMHACFHTQHDGAPRIPSFVAGTATRHNVLERNPSAFEDGQVQDDSQPPQWPRRCRRRWGRRSLRVWPP